METLDVSILWCHQIFNILFWVTTGKVDFCFIFRLVGRFIFEYLNEIIQMYRQCKVVWLPSLCNVLHCDGSALQLPDISSSLYYCKHIHHIKYIRLPTLVDSEDELLWSARWLVWDIKWGEEDADWLPPHLPGEWPPQAHHHGPSDASGVRAAVGWQANLAASDSRLVEDNV